MNETKNRVRYVNIRTGEAVYITQEAHKSGYLNDQPFIQQDEIPLTVLDEIPLTVLDETAEKSNSVELNSEEGINSNDLKLFKESIGQMEDFALLEQLKDKFKSNNFKLNIIKAQEKKLKESKENNENDK